MHWIDIVFIAVIIIFAIIGIYKGLFDSVLELIGSGGALLIAIWACKPVMNFLNKMVNLNGFFTDLIKKGGVKENVSILGKSFTPEQLGTLCAVLATVIAVWLLIKLALKLLEKLFDDISDNSTAMSSLNRLFGMFFGAAKGALILLVFIAIFGIVGKMGTFGQPIKDAINKTTITRKVSNYVDEWVDGHLKQSIIDIIDKTTKPEDNKTPDTKPGTDNNQPENNQPENTKPVAKDDVITVEKFTTLLNGNYIKEVYIGTTIIAIKLVEPSSYITNQLAEDNCDCKMNKSNEVKQIIKILVDDYNNNPENASRKVTIKEEPTSNASLSFSNVVNFSNLAIA